MNIGLVLSGGGVRGIAHIGAIQALEENNIIPTYIAGTSAGAIVGALYASGYSSDKMMQFFNSVQIFTLSKYAIKKPGFIDTEKFYDDFKSYFPTDNFDNLNKKLFVTATNLLNGQLKVFSTGELIKPILASAAFPGVFTPVKINEEYYIDGGILNNFPVDLISSYCNKLIGVYVNSFETINNNTLKHSYNVLERALKIKSANDSIKKFKVCDIIISPKDLSNYSTFYMNNFDEIFKLGYEATINVLESEQGIEFLKSSL